MLLTVLPRRLLVFVAVVIADCLPFTIPFDVEENPLTTEKLLSDTAAIANATRNIDVKPRTMMDAKSVDIFLNTSVWFHLSY